MTRNLKVLGLGLIAALALSAVVASAASAHTFTSTSPNNSTWLTGNQTTTNVFTIKPGFSVKCPVARFTGTQGANTATSVTVHPEYEGKGGSSCEVSPIGNATVDTEGCNFILTSATEETSKGVFHSTTEVECEAGKEIHVTGPCTIHIAAQKEAELAGGVTYTNGKDPTLGDVTVNSTVSSITSVVTDSFACTIAGLSPGTYGAGTYEGSVTVTGFEDKGGTIAKPTEGSQVGIEVS